MGALLDHCANSSWRVREKQGAMQNCGSAHLGQSGLSRTTQIQDFSFAFLTGSEQQFRKKKKNQSSLVPYFQNPVADKENLSCWVSASACKMVIVAESHTRKSKG